MSAAPDRSALTTGYHSGSARTHIPGVNRIRLRHTDLRRPHSPNKERTNEDHEIVAIASSPWPRARGDRRGGRAGDGREPRRHAERFKAADTNGDGLISRAEAAALPRLAKHFDAIDANKDGQVIVRGAARGPRQASAHGEHLKKLDTNGDGKVSKAEAQASAPRLAEHFDQIDANKDGFVTQEEMKAAHGTRRK